MSTSVGVMNIDWQPNGTLSYVKTLGDYGSDPTASYVMQRFAPWTTTTVQAVNGPIDEHELHVLPNGDVMIFSYILTSGVDLTGLGKLGADETVADCTAEELDTAGNLVWSWAASDHIDPVQESKGYLTNLIDGVNVVDAYHFNSIDVDGSNNVLISSRATSAVYYIDRTSGKVLWKMGGNPYSKDGAQILTFANDPEGGIDSQHDARFQANGDISVFDDHTNLGGQARGIEYAIDTAAGTASMVWQYENTTWSEAMGSFRRYSRRLEPDLVGARADDPGGHHRGGRLRARSARRDVRQQPGRVVPRGEGADDDLRPQRAAGDGRASLTR